MNLSLENKHAIICGSSDGIGKASAITMAQRGCEITLVARNQEKLDSTLLELNTKQDQQHQTVCVDFDQPEKVKESVALHIGTLGKPVDILINNSGGPHGGPIIEADENEFRVAFERLLICNQIMAKAVFPRMKEQRSGRIINIISTSVKKVIPGLGCIEYHKEVM
jgi:Short-chain dehydrogenases of various substrate specificities